MKYLGIAAFQWLGIRMGVDTVKPDVHLRRFVEHSIGRPVTDEELIRVIEVAARRLNLRAQDLDLAIWELQRGGPGTI